MNRTSQQQDFVSALLDPATKHVALVARAGCGKTTTILEATQDYAAAFPSHEIVICCFGKPIQKEIEEKLRARGVTNWRQVQATTTHAMGWNLLRFVFRSARIDDKKVSNLIRLRNEPVFQEFFSQIKELVHLAKLEGFGFFGDSQVGDKSAWYRIADHYGVNCFEETDQLDLVIEAAQMIYVASLADTSVVDFDDMILFPLVKNIHVRFQKDVIFVDEAQDTSRARRALVKKFLKPSGRLVVVGDDRQAIMGFAGASADAMDELIDMTQATVMPLNVTWRCPKAVVREAQKLVPDIQAAESAPEGEVLTLESLPDELFSTDAILCRNTAPLVKTAYALIRRRVACKVEGREIGSGLVKLLTRWKAIKSVAAFEDRLEDWTDREVQKWRAKDREDKVQEVEDRSETLRVICASVRQEGGSHIQDAVTFVESLFADDVCGVLTLCTYHRSKGREWPRVMLLEHSSRCPSPYAKQAWQKRQEDNLAYVAITRAQQTLAFVN